MRKIFLGSGLVLALLSTAACERTKSSDSEREADKEESNKVVVKRDSVPTEYEVTETVVEYDTTQRTKTVKSDVDTREDKDNDEVVRVKKDRD